MKLISINPGPGLHGFNVNLGDEVLAAAATRVDRFIGAIEGIGSGIQDLAKAHHELVQTIRGLEHPAIHTFTGTWYQDKKR